MSTHTPGPWTGAGPNFGASRPPYTTEIVTDWTDYDGTVESICTFPIKHFDAENEANARLIAAAPDLLEALKAAELALRELEYIFVLERGPFLSEDEMEQQHAWPDAVYAARAVIAKAEGKEDKP